MENYFKLNVIEPTKNMNGQNTNASEANVNAVNYEEINAKVRELIAQLTTEEKLSMVQGPDELWTGMIELAKTSWNRVWKPAGAIPRLGIAGISFLDGPRGVIVAPATTFPVSMARGATFDVELEEQIGAAMGKEARAHDANAFGGVCVNVLRHPAWGRSQETYGEDTAHLAAMGAAITRGVQRHLMAIVKHFALNSMENARFQVNVTVGERAAHEVYLRQFEKIVEAGAAVILSAYNSVNGEWCGQSNWLLNDVLRKMWNFQGLVVTDFVFGMRDAKKAALAGQDLELPFKNIFARDLPKLIESGEVSMERLDEMIACSLRQQLRFAPILANKAAVDAAAHSDLARECAAKSIVLLKNTGVLPLAAPKHLAVIGRLADTPNTGDHGSSSTLPAHIVTPLAGLKTALDGSSAKITYDAGENVNQAVAAAKDADAVIIVVGNDYRDEGESLMPANYNELLKEGVLTVTTPEQAEIAKQMGNASQTPAPAAAADGKNQGKGGDRDSLRIHPEDEALIQAVAAANPRTIVALMGGGAFITEAWREQVAAILMLWYPGQEGGHAFADIVFGRVNPSGRLPLTFPRDAADLPFFDKNAVEITYDLWHGYRKLERDGNAAAFPFGFGLSYTDFAYSNLKLEQNELTAADTITATLDVTNTGDKSGEEVVQLYVSVKNSAVERAPKELKTFARVALAPHETKSVRLELPTADLAYWQTGSGWTIEPTSYEILVGRFSADPKMLAATLTIKAASAA